MHVLFPNHPLAPRRVEPDFEGQAEAARSAGFDVAFIDHEALSSGNVERALRFCRRLDAPEAALYRGWMLRAEDYAAFYEACLGRNLQLVTAPEGYATCHQLPGWYDMLLEVTPRSNWVELAPTERTPETLPWERIFERAREFGDAPIIVKDWVKSRKHEWNEACFIPSASGRDAVRRVVSRFVVGQSESLVGGLVFREWVEFQVVGEPTPGQMPPIIEERHWVWGSDPFFASSQHSDAGTSAPLDFLRPLCNRVHHESGNRFFTMDVARKLDGDWMVIEIGDGQVSGLASESDAPTFYSQLFERLGS